MINSKKWKALNKLQVFMSSPVLKQLKSKTFFKSSEILQVLITPKVRVSGNLILITANILVGKTKFSK